jgi:hypothetical protein
VRFSSSLPLAAVLAVLSLVAATACGGSTPASFEHGLRESKEIEVATRRANGEWSSFAPIWFYYDGDAVYFTTAPTSNKGKRIAAGSPVLVKLAGKQVEAKTEIIRDTAIVDRMGDEYARKYWIAWLGLFRPRADRMASGKTLVIRAALPEAR